MHGILRNIGIIGCTAIVCAFLIQPVHSSPTEPSRETGMTAAQQSIRPGIYVMSGLVFDDGRTLLNIGLGDSSVGILSNMNFGEFPQLFNLWENGLPLSIFINTVASDQIPEEWADVTFVGNHAQYALFSDTDRGDEKVAHLLRALDLLHEHVEINGEALKSKAMERRVAAREAGRKAEVKRLELESKYRLYGRRSWVVGVRHVRTRGGRKIDPSKIMRVEPVTSTSLFGEQR